MYRFYSNALADKTVSMLPIRCSVTGRSAPPERWQIMSFQTNPKFEHRRQIVGRSARPPSVFSGKEVGPKFGIQPRARIAHICWWAFPSALPTTMAAMVVIVMTSVLLVTAKPVNAYHSILTEVTQAASPVIIKIFILKKFCYFTLSI